MKKLIFFVLVLLVSSVSAQYLQSGMIDGATGNLVYTTSTAGYNNPPPNGDWTGYNWSGFTGTSSTGGGYSGGYSPGWNSTTGTFLFGYNQGTIKYSSPVNYALAAAGTGIQVNGFKYSWDYLNQDYSRGTLTGNINLTGTNGQVLQNYNYTMPRTTNGWTNMSGIENFNTQYSVSSVGNLNVSFTGKDDRWWAGYYGPQIKDISVSLLYSVLPPPVQTDFSQWVKLTNENGDFTLTTAGVVRYGANGTYIYANFQPGTYSCSNGAWGRDPLGGVYKECDFGSNATTTTTTSPVTNIIKTITATSTTTTTDSTSTTTSATAATTSPTVVAAPTTTTTTAATTSPGTTDTSSATSSNLIGSVTASPTIVSAPAPVSTSTTSTTTASTSSSSSSTTTSTTQSTKDSGGSGSGTTSLALSVISKNQERDAAGSAVAQTAVAQAQAAANQAQQDATNVATSAVSNSLTASVVTIGGQQSSGGLKVNGSGTSGFTLQSGVTSLSNVLNGPQTTSVSTSQQNNTSYGTSSINNQQVASVNLGPQAQSLQQLSYNTQTQTQFQSVTQNNTQTQTSESYSMVSSGALTDKTNPLNVYLESKLNYIQNNMTTNMSTVNRNAQNNEVAGGVDINRMAVAPTGYGDYLNLVMRDVAFYAPKEVYRNQRNVDNARALRQMTSDSKHKEMVEMQYVK